MIDSLRISVTKECNLDCSYCHNEGQTGSGKEKSVEEIKKIAKSAKNVGIKKIKITGGEPLLRDDIPDVVKAFKDFDFEDISMVTNGSYLKKYAKALKKAGLDRINIGCDSLRPGYLKNKENMIDGLKAAKEAGFSPIKINMVVLKDINHNEIHEMIEFAKQNNAILQLIELINTNKDYYKNHYYSLKDIEFELGKKAVGIITRKMHNRNQYDLGDVTVEIVRPFSKNFCKNCTRIRITADHKIKTCILRNDNLTEFEGKDSLLKAIFSRSGLND